MPDLSVVTASRPLTRASSRGGVARPGWASWRYLTPGVGLLMAGQGSLRNPCADRASRQRGQRAASALGFRGGAVAHCPVGAGFVPHPGGVDLPRGFRTLSPTTPPPPSTTPPPPLLPERGVTKNWFVNHPSRRPPTRRPGPRLVTCERLRYTSRHSPARRAATCHRPAPPGPEWPSSGGHTGVSRSSLAQKHRVAAVKPRHHARPNQTDHRDLTA